ncbi:hypothetical protein DSO57_1012819 [Entomophthora muscae]|uniref:Uncharacterized protein n=1 Tax=Entomophthora muscae TaxID=34485 RepID=A0ACC2RKN6_9FUNG|nr:hypothetical protein DSO57_1012819 [Entomophthora muscae]
MFSCRPKNLIKQPLREHRLAASQITYIASSPFAHFSTRYRNSFSANRHLIIQPLLKNTQAGLGIVKTRNFFNQSVINDSDTPKVNQRNNLSLPGEMGFFKQVLNIARDPEDKEHELVDLKESLNSLGELSKSERKASLELERLFKRIRLDNFTIKQVELLRAEYENGASSGMFYHTRTYNYLIYYYSSTGRIEHVEGVLGKMQSSKVTADELTYTFLIDAYANQGNLDKARLLFEELQSKMQITSLHPYANLIKACIKNNQLSLAFDILNQMQTKFKPNSVIFTLLIQACIKAKDIDEAWKTFELMRKSDCEIGLKVYTLMMSCARESETDKAIEIFEEMLTRDIFPTRRAVHGLLTALSTRASHYPKAVHILDLALKDNHFRPNAITFKIMLNAAQICHNLKDARLFFSKIILSIGNDPEAFPAYSSLFLTYASAFQPDDLQRTLNPQPTKLTLQAILDLPAPRTIDEAVEEARLIMADFENNIQTEGVLLTRVRQSYTVMLANYGYFSEATEAFASYFIRTSITPHPGIFRSMLRMCYSLKKQRAFDRFHNHLMDLLEPIRPASQLTVRQKKDYQISNCLLGPVLDDIYSDLIRGLTT